MTLWRSEISVITATSVMMTVIWDAAPCSLINTDPDNGGTRFALTSVNFYHTARCYIPEDSHLDIVTYFATP
jgi:hypothetical protein